MALTITSYETKNVHGHGPLYLRPSTSAALEGMTWDDEDGRHYYFDGYDWLDYTPSAETVGADPAGTGASEAAAAVAAHEAAADPHPGYLTPTEGDAAYDAIGAAAAAQSAAEGYADTAVSTHEAAADPHPGYLTPAEGDAAYDAIGAASAAQSAAEGYADTAVSTHAGDTDPHGDRGYADGLISSLAAIASSGSFTDLAGLTAGDLIVADSGDAASALPIGTDGQVLMVNASGAPEWSDNYATDLRIRAKNGTGTSVSKGLVVFINGASGSLPTFGIADATTEAGSAYTIGVVDSATIADGHTGFVAISGTVKGINTASFAAGAILWLGTSAGTFTDTRPAAPNHGVQIGWVIESGASGSILLHLQNGHELDELHNVAISSVANGNALVYDSATTTWKNHALTASDVGAVSTTDTRLNGSGQFVFHWRNDGGLTAPDTADVVVPYAGTITGWTVVEDTGATASATFDLWLGTPASPPTVSNSIVNAAYPTLTTGTNATGTTTGWTTTAVTVGALLRAQLKTVSSAKRLTLVVTYAR